MVYCIPAWICRGGGIYLQCTEKCTISSLQLHDFFVPAHIHYWRSKLTFHSETTCALLLNISKLPHVKVINHPHLGHFKDWGERSRLYYIIPSLMCNCIWLHRVAQQERNPCIGLLAVGEINFHFLYVRWQNFLFSTKW